MRHHTISLALAVAVALVLPAAACADSDDGFATGVLALVDGQPDAVGVLRFLNDASTTLEVLDDDAGLNRRAAENLIAWRDGDDGAFGTADDRRFAAIREVLAVRQVGPAALDQILAYARENGWIPAGDDLLGIYKGVSFSVVEAEATLTVANVSPAAVLLGEVNLQSRTVNQIIAARPILSVEALSNVLYVGTVSLERLRAYGLSIDPPVACFDDAPCGDGERCRDAEPASEIAGVCRHDSELLGVYSGVTFTVGDADATLALVNLGGDALLTADVGLTSRAVENIVAARPIATVPALADVPQVGPVSLERARDFARANPAVIAALITPPVTGGCASSAECGEGEVCAVYPAYWSAEGVNECRTADSLTQAHHDCLHADPLCAEGYICVGLIYNERWGGMCSPAWMATEVDLGTIIVAAGAERTVDFTISGLASVPVDAAFDFETSATNVQATLTLGNPYETVVPVWPHAWFPGAPLAGRHLFFTPGDEAVNGSWRLRVHNAGDSALVIDRARLFITSRWD